MNRRSLLLSAAGAGFAVSGLAPPRGLAAATATDDELAYASFGQAAELCSRTSTRGGPREDRHGAAARELAHGALSATEHAAALAKLLTDAGQTASVAEDFEFAWPEGRSPASGRPNRAPDRAAAPRRVPGRRDRRLDRVVPDAVRDDGANVAQQVAALSGSPEAAW